MKTAGEIDWSVLWSKNRAKFPLESLQRHEFLEMFNPNGRKLWREPWF